MYINQLLSYLVVCHQNHQYLLIIIHQFEEKYFIPLVSLEFLSVVSSITPHSLFFWAVVVTFELVFYFSGVTYLCDELECFDNI